MKSEGCGVAGHETEWEWGVATQEMNGKRN